MPAAHPHAAAAHLQLLTPALLFIVRYEAAGATSSSQPPVYSGGGRVWQQYLVPQLFSAGRAMLCASSWWAMTTLPEVYIGGQCPPYGAKVCRA